MECKFCGENCGNEVCEVCVESDRTREVVDNETGEVRYYKDERGCKYDL